jgi:hypothetical protein
MPVDFQTMRQELSERQTEIEKVIANLQRELEQVKSVLGSIEGNPSPSRYSWSELALDCVRNRGVFLQTSEILECAVSKEDLADEKKRRNALVAASIALNNLCAKGVLRKVVVNGVKGHFYGLPEWFDEKGIIKQHQIANIMAKYGRITEPVKMDLATMLAAGLLE